MSRALPESKSIAACAMTCTSSSLPAPLSPQARWPVAGATMRTPREASTERLCCVAGFSHMPVFMAGATSTGARVASTVVESMSSAIPQAILARMFAVAGAMRNKSARLASATCSTSHVAGRSNVSHATGWPERVSKVSGATKRPAFFVITTYTSAPCFCSRRSSSQALYAAMPPVTPRTTHFLLFSSIAYRTSASGVRS